MTGSDTPEAYHMSNAAHKKIAPRPSGADLIASSDRLFLTWRQSDRRLALVVPALANTDVLATSGDDSANFIAVANVTERSELVKARRREIPALTERAPDGCEPEKADNSCENLRSIHGILHSK